MPDAFVLRRVILGGKETLPLTAQDAAAWRQACADIREMLDVEEKFDIVLANLVELEKELAARALQSLFHSEHSAREMMDDRQAFNRRVVNVLTTTKLYVDQTKHHIKAFFPSMPAAWAELDTAFSAEYDAHLAYRAMEALRNYAQHRGLPLQGFTHSNKWIEQEGEDRRMEANVALNLNIEELAADGKFKSSVLKELADIGKTVDIKLMIRQYVECLGRVHVYFRGAVEERVVAARALLSKWAGEFALLSKDPQSNVALALVQQHENGTYDPLDYYPNYSLESLDILQARIGTLANLSRRTISTKPLH